MMANTISGNKQAQQQELNDISDDFRRRRRETIKQNEESLASLKQEYQRKLANEKETNEATVNHIRKQSGDRIQEIRTEAEKKVSSEQHAKEQDVALQRQRNLSQKEQLILQRDQQDKYYTELIAKARRDKMNAVSKEQEHTQSYQKEQSAKRSQVQKGYAQEMDALAHETSEKKAQVLGQNRDEIAQLNAKQRDEIKKTQTDFQNQIEGQRTKTFETIKRQADDHQKTFETNRQQQQATLDELELKMHEQYAKEQADGTRKIDETKTENTRQIHGEVERGTKQMELVRKDYDKNIKIVHQKGEQKVTTQKQHFEELAKLQANEYQKEIDQKKQLHQNEIQKRDELHLKKMGARDDEYKLALKQQGEEFRKTFGVNEKVNRAALNEQHDRVVTEMIKQKEGLLARFGKYSNTESDPFYKMQEFETRISDQETFYLLRTKVPEHELKNVDVIVKDDKVVVSGQREFKEKVKNDGRKITTNSSQSFREEIPLKHPTMPKLVEKSYEDGTIAVMIPKIPIR